MTHTISDRIDKLKQELNANNELVFDSIKEVALEFSENFEQLRETNNKLMLSLSESKNENSNEVSIYINSKQNRPINIVIVDKDP